MSNYENDSNEPNKKEPIKTGKKRSFWKSVGKIAMAVVPLILLGLGGKRNDEN